MKPSEMSDEALTKATAEEVMGWNFIQSEDNRYDDLWHAPASKDGWAIGIKEWDPLHRADHWWMVVERLTSMGIAGWDGHITFGRAGVFNCAFYNQHQTSAKEYASSGYSIGRVILEAALAAVRGKEGE